MDMLSYRAFPGLCIAVSVALGACSEQAASQTASDAGTQTDGGKDAGSDAGRDASSDAGARDGGDVDPEAKIGEFGLQLVAPVPASADTSATEGFSSLLGKVYDGPVPEAIVWETQQEEDGCTLRTPRYPFCDPACGSGVCTEDDTCTASPSAKSVGKLTLEGLSAEVGDGGVLTVSPAGTTYTSTGLPYPAFEEGAELTLSAAGAALPAFSVTSHGIAPLTLTGGPYVLRDGEPLALEWTKAAADAESRIQIKLDISHHGGTKGKIECDVPDDGALTISADMVDALKALGVAGFPTVMVTRSSVGSVSTASGRIDLRVYTYVEQSIEIPGLVSCSEDGDCPSGQSCQDDKTCS